eukprot:728261-Prymnesium_polylepis.1
MDVLPLTTDCTTTCWTDSANIHLNFFNNVLFCLLRVCSLPVRTNARISANRSSPRCRFAHAPLFVSHPPTRGYVPGCPDGAPCLRVR